MKRDAEMDAHFDRLERRRRPDSHRGSIDWNAEEDFEHADVERVVLALMARSDQERWPGGVPPPVEYHGSGVCPMCTTGSALPGWIMARWDEIEQWNERVRNGPADPDLSAMKYIGKARYRA